MWIVDYFMPLQQFTIYLHTQKCIFHNENNFIRPIFYIQLYNIQMLKKKNFY